MGDLTFFNWSTKHRVFWTNLFIKNRNLRKLTLRILGEYVIEYTVSDEFATILAAKVLIQHPKLGLTLIEFFVITALQSYACMSLVNMNGKRIAYSLNRKILSNRFKLVARVSIVLLCYPAFLHVRQRCLEYTYRSHRGCSWSLQIIIHKLTLVYSFYA